MKILLSVALIIVFAVSAHAEEIFSDIEVKNIQLKKVNVDDESALIRAADAGEVEIVIGDTIGVERAIITKIGKASITVQHGNTRTKIPVAGGF